MMRVRFMWWLGLNLLIMPSIFMHEGYLIALVILVFAIELFKLNKGLKSRLISNKLLGESVLKNALRLLLPVKFVEIMQFQLNSKIYSSFKIASMRANLYMKGIDLTTLTLLCFLVLI